MRESRKLKQKYKRVELIDYIERLDLPFGLVAGMSADQFREFVGEWFKQDIEVYVTKQSGVVIDSHVRVYP